MDGQFKGEKSEQELISQKDHLEQLVTERTFALRESEALFGSQFDFGNIGIVLTTLKKEWLRVNKRFCEILGYQEKELLKKTWSEISCPEDSTDDISQFSRILSGEIDRYEIDKRLVRKDGTIIYANLNVSCYRSPDRTPRFIIALLQDITERRRVEDELNESIARYRNLTDHSKSIILEWDPEGNVVFLNKYGLEFFGFAENEIIGHNVVGTIVEPVDTIGYDLQEKMDDVQQYPDDYYSSENENICKDGRRVWMAWTNIGIRDNKDRLIKTLSVGIDRTRQKQAEEELETYRKDLETINKNLKIAKDDAEAANRAKSIFLANMSHELRTPLNAVLGFSQLMQNVPDMPVRHQKNLGIINRSGTHLLALINDILEISKIEAGKIVLNTSTFDLRALLNDIENMFRSKTEPKKLQLLLETDESLPLYVVSDEGKLRQVLINLLGNAVKFTKKGGIVLRAECRKGVGLELKIEVEDTGIGIGLEELDRIFQPFEQTISGMSQGGTGLGLVITREYARLMGGDLIVQSEKGRGSIFTFTCGISEGSAENAMGRDDEKKVIRLEPGGSPVTILVVDDVEDNRDLVVQLLGPVGFKTLEAANGEEAVNMFEIHSPDLIFMDMRMPVMDGYKATRRIRELPGGDSVKIIALTASAFEEQRPDIKASGCDDISFKPFKSDELFELISQYLGVKYLYDETTAGDVKDVFEIDIKQIAAIPLEWREELRQAAAELFPEAAKKVIGRIKDQNAGLARSLTSLVEKFAFYELIKLLDSVTKNEKDTTL
jgi:PAS domain S-box-containing protein